MRRRAALGLLALVALVAATGCVGGGEADVGANITPETEPADTDRTGDEILASSVDAAEEAETYRAESETRMDVATVFGVSVSMNTTGEFDDGEGLAHTSTDGESTVDFLVFSGGGGFETEVYQTPEARYTRASNGTETGDWNTTEARAPLSPGLGDMSATVEDAEASIEGVGDVNGNEAYVLSLDVPVSALGDSFSRAMGVHGEDRFGDDEGSENVSEADVDASETYLWVDRGTDRPLRFAYRVNVGFEGDGGNGTASGSMEFLVDTRYSGYGEGVSVEAPDGVGG